MTTLPCAPLCALADLADLGSAAFTVTAGGERLRVMVIRRGGDAFGYVNSCPHVLARLDGNEAGQFLNFDRQYILCGNHGAIFDIATGLCLRCPCEGRRLTPYALVVRDGWVVPVAPDHPGQP